MIFLKYCKIIKFFSLIKIFLSYLDLICINYFYFTTKKNKKFQIINKFMQIMLIILQIILQYVYTYFMCCTLKIQDCNVPNNELIINMYNLPMNLILIKFI